MNVYMTDITHKLESLPRMENLPIIEDTNYKDIYNYGNNIYRFNNSLIFYGLDKDGKELYISAYRMFISKNFKDPYFGFKDMTNRTLIPDMWSIYKLKLNEDNSMVIFKRFKEKTKDEFLPTVPSNTNWNGVGYIGLSLLKRDGNNFEILHDYVPDSWHLIDKRFTDPHLNEGLAIEDPRLYRKADGNIYMYYMTYISPNKCNQILDKYKMEKTTYIKCFVVYEVPVIVMDDQYLFIGSRSYKSNRNDFNKFLPTNLMCPISHTENSPGNFIIDKSYVPFNWKNEDYFIYTIQPFKVYKYREGGNCKLIKNVDLPFLDGLKKLYVIYDTKDKFSKHLLKFALNSPAIDFIDKNGRVVKLSSGHLRIGKRIEYYIRNPGYFIKNIKKAFEYTSINDSLVKFLEKEYSQFDEGELVLHDDIYFSFLFTFDPENLKMLKMSDAFIFDYPNRKFTLDFICGMTSNNKDILISFGQGDCLSRIATFSTEKINSMLKYNFMDNTIKSLSMFSFQLLEVSLENCPDTNFNLQQNMTVKL